jgi:uncharacterized protein involved in response to NO
MPSASRRAERSSVGRQSSWRAPIWGRGFRPFFLLAGLHGCGGVLAWIAILAIGAPAPAWLGPTLWHGHEMLFGVVTAAIAGFLSTSVPVWTGSRAVAGGRLAALAALWTAGRVAMLAAGVLPTGGVAALDLAFLPALAGTLARPLWVRGQARNWGFVPILIVLFGCNGVMHAQALGVLASGASAALRVGVDLVIVLIAVIGGRITPAFTANAFKRSGIAAPVRSRRSLDRAAIAAVLLVAALDIAAARTRWSGGAALLAAIAVAGRMLSWQSLRTTHDPLLWSLHLGQAWIPLGLLLVGVADLTLAIPIDAGLHALIAGAAGATILAVMTRVGLGHTGRPLVAPPGAVAVYALVNAGALVRVLAPILWPASYLPALVLAGAFWASAFGLFVVVYWPILTRVRVDGLPG